MGAELDEYAVFLDKLTTSPTLGEQAHRQLLGLGSGRLDKVGPKGYIHGWIYLGPQAPGTRVFHPRHGHGTVNRSGQGRSTVHFDDGKKHSFEAAHKPKAKEHFSPRTTGQSNTQAAPAGSQPASPKPSSRAVPTAGTKPASGSGAPGSHVSAAEQAQLDRSVEQFPPGTRAVARRWANAIRSGNYRAATNASYELSRALPHGDSDARRLLDRVQGEIRERHLSDSMAATLRRGGSDGLGDITAPEARALGLHTRDGGLDTPEQAAHRLAELRRSGTVLPPSRPDGVEPPAPKAPSKPAAPTAAERSAIVGRLRGQAPKPHPDAAERAADAEVRARVDGPEHGIGAWSGPGGDQVEAFRAQRERTARDLGRARADRAERAAVSDYLRSVATDPDGDQHDRAVAADLHTRFQAGIATVDATIAEHERELASTDADAQLLRRTAQAGANSAPTAQDRQRRRDAEVATRARVGAEIESTVPVALRGRETREAEAKITAAELRAEASENRARELRANQAELEAAASRATTDQARDALLASAADYRRRADRADGEAVLARGDADEARDKLDDHLRANQPALDAARTAEARDKEWMEGAGGRLEESRRALAEGRHSDAVNHLTAAARLAPDKQTERDILAMRSDLAARLMGKPPKAPKPAARKPRAAKGTGGVDVAGDVAKREQRHDEATRRLHHYWTRGDGLTEWLATPHPWQALYDNLLPHIGDPGKTRRTTSQWFHDATGLWPGERFGHNPLGPG